MTILNRAHSRPEIRTVDPLYDHSHEYRSSTVPRRYVNGTTIFCAIILVVWGIAIICKH